MRISQFRLLFILSSAFLFSCTEDRDIEAINIQDPIENEDLELVHYWNFNDTANLQLPTFSQVSPSSFTYLGDRFDEVNEGTAINVRFQDDEGSALRLRNPSGDFILRLSTEGFTSPIFTYATTRTNNGPQVQSLSYSLDGVNFTSEGLPNTSYGVPTDWVLKQFDFAEIEGASNNPNFSIRIQFSENADGDSGNSRFDNITIDAEPIEGGSNEEEEEEEENEQSIMYYWNFNNTASEEALITANEFVGAYELVYEGNFFDETDGSLVNARNDDAAGAALRLRNPAGPFFIKASTENFKEIHISYATRRTNNGALEQLISYTLNGTDFITDGLTQLVYPIEVGGEAEEFSLIEIDLSAIEGINNNPNFQLKIDFGPGAENSSGNNRIDNLVIEGIQL